MPCYRPIECWRSKHKNPSGKRSLVFSEKHALQPDDVQKISCGVCVGCRMDKANEWSIRMMHESQYHDENLFITLTYNDESLWSKDNPMSLDYRDIQLFNKKLRKKGYQFRFYMAGEYGPTNGRPHWHGIYFGLSLPDLEDIRLSPRQDIYYGSKTLEQTWGMGYVTIGALTPESAAYTARYTMKKQRGDSNRTKENANGLDKLGEPCRLHWTNPDSGEVLPLNPERSAMSMRPGIGAQWIKENLMDTYKDDFVVFGGRERRVPRYYDNVLLQNDPWKFDDIKFDRQQKAKEMEQDLERLRVMEQCKQYKIDKLVRYV